jgi:hypothetical protein
MYAEDMSIILLLVLPLAAQIYRSYSLGVFANIARLSSYKQASKTFQLVPLHALNLPQAQSSMNHNWVLISISVPIPIPNRLTRRSNSHLHISPSHNALHTSHLHPPRHPPRHPLTHPQHHRLDTLPFHQHLDRRRRILRTRLRTCSPRSLQNPRLALVGRIWSDVQLRQ